jgi:hypothetical protein
MHAEREFVHPFAGSCSAVATLSPNTVDFVMGVATVMQRKQIATEERIAKSLD